MSTETKEEPILHENLFQMYPLHEGSQWDKRFMGLAEQIATYSKDPSRGVGAVISGPDRTIRAMGYNGLPRGCEDDPEAVPERYKRPVKYYWTEHAERNAIYNSVRAGTDIRNCTIYTTLYPCADCARAIAQVGLTTVVTYKPHINEPVWREHFEIAAQMFLEAGVKLKLIKKD